MSTASFHVFVSGRLCVIVLATLGILGAAQESLRGNNIAYRETIYDTDFVSAGVGGMRDSSSAVINIRGISGTVNKAYLYWHGPMNSLDPLANAVIRLNGQVITGSNIGFSDDNCWGFDNSQGYRADVTSFVRAGGNGAYVLSQFVKDGTNINANGASLLVFFNDSKPSNNRDIVLFDGNDSNAENAYDALGWNVTLAGINYSTGRGFLQVHVSDGQIYEDDSVIVNGTVLQGRGSVFQGTTVPSANDGPMGFGSLWDIKTWNITSIFTPGTNTLTLTHGYIRRDCISLVIAVINLPAGAAPTPENRPPVVNGTPEITVHTPNPIVVQAEATDPDGDPLTYTISIDGTVVQNGSIPSGTPVSSGHLSVTNAFALGQHTVVFTANDGHVSGTFTTVVNVTDITPPVLHLPPDLIVPTDPGKITAVVNYVVTVTDDFPGPVVISLPAPGNAFPIGTTTVTATAVDSSGNRTQDHFTITVTNAVPPVLNCPPNIVQGIDPGANSAVVHYSIGSSPGMTFTCTPSSGSTFPTGTTTVVCQGSDAAGNTASCQFTVTVTNTVPPALNCPPDIVQATDPGSNRAVVHYSVGGSPGMTFTCTPASGSAFRIGTTTVVCRGRDAAGNTASCQFTVTILDQEPPVITVPTNQIVATPVSQCSASVRYTVTVRDNQPGATVTCSPPPNSPFPLGPTTVTCTATDVAGNKSTNAFTVTVVDTEKPTLHLPPNISVTVASNATGTSVNYNVTAADNCSGVTTVCTPPSGSTFPVGTTPVNCTATDSSGNATNGSFTVTVSRPGSGDTEPPVILRIIPNPRVLWPPNHKMVMVTLSVATSDNSGKPVTCRIVSVTSNEPQVGMGSGDTPIDWEITGDLKVKLRAERSGNGSGRVYTITVECKDAAGNIAVGSTTVTVPHSAPKAKSKGKR